MSKKTGKFPPSMRGLIRRQGDTITIAYAEGPAKRSASFIVTYYLIGEEAFRLLSTYPVEQLDRDFIDADGVRLDLVPGAPRVIDWFKKKFAAGEMVRHQQCLFYSDFYRDGGDKWEQ